MNCRLAVTILAVAFSLSTSAECGADEPAAAEKAADAMLGKEPGQVREDNGLRMKLVWCPPGKFTMGSPESEADRRKNEDQVEVTLTKGFWLGKYEVSQAEWKQLIATEPWKRNKGMPEGDDFPAAAVNWDDGMEFCRRFTERERDAGQLPEGWEYTLPTEAQWERACRAGTETKFSFGDDESKLAAHAWFLENAANAGEVYAHRVGQMKPNGWGLYDIHGNVWEWCRDWCGDKLPGGSDPEDTEKGRYRAARGGCWGCTAGLCRSAGRSRFAPSLRMGYMGFRVALSPVENKKSAPPTQDTAESK
jgi:formylglycine-generating enzyme required for sulfatase activity